ncbi:4285_t:CDS:2 [Funneliformis mosseae]|uniref:4285_t:CDS:1 n=1 Tax=Funneliformis mosseae TaxID=27381 RepID=A0A9N8W6Y5_FUNMO|nr:4285_t:CDS:2 [Funneliformis mosseae]
MTYDFYIADTFTNLISFAKLMKEKLKGKNNIIIIDQNIYDNDDADNDNDIVRDYDDFKENFESLFSRFNASENMYNNDNLEMPIINFNEGFN